MIFRSLRIVVAAAADVADGGAGGGTAAAAAGAHCRLEVLGQLLLVTVRERERAGAAKQGLLIAHTQCCAQ